ncbi:hypothetical protein [Oscillatoria sp. HE19RPO]|uniref:hypothetical protein n=1 Tax=Oscillatoria sp. HE19RPO TaxID=2954806 RepID=UPI0020C3B918|nr:hypothetical protein [Oscillatoria sp. HE19RPO]
MHSALMICLEIENSGDRLSGRKEWVKSPTETEKPVQAFHPPGLTRARTDLSTQRFPSQNRAEKNQRGKSGDRG